MRAIVLLLVLCSASGCTAMLVGGDVGSRGAADCESDKTETCKK